MVLVILQEFDLVHLLTSSFSILSFSKLFKFADWREDGPLMTARHSVEFAVQNYTNIDLI